LLKRVFASKYRGYIFLLLGVTLGIVSLAIGLERNGGKKHNFEGKCQLCHENIPSQDTPFEEIELTDNVNRLCANCHQMDVASSHPTDVKLKKTIPFQRYLDKTGQMTCITCHDVHKEDRIVSNKTEFEGLLRGHVQGRSFCFTCHQEEILGTGSWRHKLVISYAHASGQLEQWDQGAFLDSFSVECLSCHDGVISKMETVKIKGGDFKHGIGLSHPVGVEYPQDGGRKNDYVPISALPKELKLFDGKIGCLTCHNPYGNKNNHLVMENRRSALCLACHNK